MQTLKNDILTVEVSEIGAELQSIRSAQSGREYMWQGDPAYWNRRAPVLFPMVGKVWNGRFIMDGREWPMGQHGFARDCRFDIVESSDTRLVCSLRSDERTLALYPRDFTLTITYTLDGGSLAVTWDVLNSGLRRLPFQIGAHPAFAYPDWDADSDLYGYLSFDVADRLVSTALAPGGYRSSTAPAFDVALDAEGRLPLRPGTFDCDTIIDSRDMVRSVTLHDAHSVAYLRMRFDMPIIALWSPFGGRAPFVCIEPWCGSCDIEGYSGEYEDRDVIHNLLPGERFVNTYHIDIL